MEGHAVVVARFGSGVRAACSCGGRVDAFRGPGPKSRNEFTAFAFGKLQCSAVMLAYRRLKKAGAA